jgi:amidase
MNISLVSGNSSGWALPRRRLVPLARSFLVSVILVAVPAAVRAAEKTKFQVEEATIADIHKAILAKELTATELVNLYLARIKAYNGPGVEQPEGVLGPVKFIPRAKGINALSTLNLRPATRKAMGFDDHTARTMTDATDTDPKMPDALEVAAALDKKFAATGKLVGPLHGVVMAIKDQYDTFDLRTTSGADVPYANDRPPLDAEFVKRLRDAGAIILAKSNLGEYATGTPRSSFGGVFVNPYDTERTPAGSSSGSGSAVAANLVTCSIAEETSSSIRGPARANAAVGIAGTQELVSRHGMIQYGIHTRCGPIARTVEDAARILTVIAGYDPKDPMTGFAADRMPSAPYESFTKEKSLKGMRIGVVREYMDKPLFTKADEESIDLVEKAIADLKKLGAEIVDPGTGNGLFTDYVQKMFPMLVNATFTKAHPGLFPVEADGKAKGDHLMTLLDLAFDPSKSPAKLTIRDIGGGGGGGGGGAAANPGPGGAFQAIGEGRYTMNLYLRERGDANIKTLTDLIAKANFFTDPQFTSRKPSLETADKALHLDTAARMQRRFAVQQIVLAAFADMKLDAVVYPTSNLPPAKLGAPAEPSVNGRGSVWSFLGQQGFPAITVPAGFTKTVYDRVRDPNAPTPPAGARGGGGGEDGGGGRGNTVPSLVVGPVPAKLPVGIDFLGRPFSEPILLKIAAAYENATHHRVPPPDFGPLTATVATAR